MKRSTEKEAHTHTGQFLPQGERAIQALHKRERVDSAGLLGFLQGIAAQWPARSQIAFLCIGTDRSTGDALGPLVGDVLTSRGWPHVRGTLAAPCDAANLHSMLGRLPSNCIVIAVDACLGRPVSIGSFLVSQGPLRPAQAIGGTLLPDVGDYSIAGVVNVHSAKPYHTLQTTSLHDVMKMAGMLAEAICTAWPEAIQS